MYNGFVRSTVIDMKKTYFIDSENVGDSWVSLLSVISDEDELLVFYTKKSPHMNYRNVVLLMESSKKIQFIECLEGNNALDFQLSTELGFRLSNIKDDAFVIVSNDNGYNAVVKYWSSRNINVSRVTGKELASLPESNTHTDEPASLETATPVTMPAAKAATEPVTVQADLPKEPKTTSPAADAEKPSEPAKAIVDDNARELLFIFGKANLQELHESLQQLYGAKNATPIYNDLKSGNAYGDFLAAHAPMSLNEKRDKYCSIVFSVSLPGESIPDGFSEHLWNSWNEKKNLNSLRSSLQQKYGKNKSSKYYTVFKVHIKIIANIK